MGKGDIKVIPVPRKDLLTWWNRLNPANQGYVEGRLGHLVDLLKVNYQSALIQALARLWDPKTATFNFRGIELTPTLEEYTAIIGADFEDHMVQPILGKDSTQALSKFLQLKIPQIEKIYKANSGKFTFAFLFNNYSSLPIETGHRSGKVFILAFFAFVLFPTSPTTFDPAIVHIAKQACNRWNYAYMILAETFLALNRFQSTQRGVFQASASLLHMWFTCHIKTFNLRVGCYEISQHVHPLRVYLRCQALVTQRSFKEWTHVLKNLEPHQIRWRLTWPKLLKARITGADGGPVPLLGHTGGTLYYPIRVVRQYGMLQEIPPETCSKEYIFDLPRGSLTDETRAAYQAKIDLIVNTLEDAPLQDVEWPDHLDGEMNLHRASRGFIQEFKKNRQSLAEPYVPEQVTTRELEDEPYVPEYIVPHMPGVEPYVPEDMGPPPSEEDEDARTWDWEEAEHTEGTLGPKRLRID